VHAARPYHWAQQPMAPSAAPTECSRPPPAALTSMLPHPVVGPHTSLSHSTTCAAVGRSAGSSWVQERKMRVATGGAPFGSLTSGAPPSVCGTAWAGGRV
jgi:hypothetical protein